MLDAFTPLVGSFLLADLDVTDPMFSRSVVLILEHTTQNAFGLIVNKPIEEMARLMMRLDNVNFFRGGPVSRTLFCLHNGLPAKYRTEGERLIAPGIWFEPSLEGLKLYSDESQNQAKLNSFSSLGKTLNIYEGYAGWGPQQLDSEIHRGLWHPIPAQASLVFERPPESLWKEGMQSFGGFLSLVAQSGFKPSRN